MLRSSPDTAGVHAATDEFFASREFSDLRFSHTMSKLQKFLMAPEAKVSLLSSPLYPTKTDWSKTQLTLGVDWSRNSSLCLL